MKRIGYSVLTALALVAFASVAQAQTPNPNGVFYSLRFFNDCPASTVTTGGSYPSSFYIDDSVLPCSGFANLHIWQFSEDGGATGAVFHNNSNFHFCADLVISGQDTNGGEAGINIAPWWFPADGRINCRIPDGEIAAFGGRMPFYSWTGNHGLHYVQDTPIHLEMTYISGPYGPSAAAPGQVQYSVTYGGNTYTTPWFLLDEGNVSEAPVHGSWGILNPASAGGFFQPRLDPGNFNSNLRATFSNVCYDNLQVVPTQSTSWGRLKGLYR
jgi:hypothetical protein